MFDDGLVLNAPVTTKNQIGFLNSSHFSTLQTSNTDSRFVKKNYDAGFNFKLNNNSTDDDVVNVKSPTNKKIIRNAEANVSIVIKQKKLDKTNFSSKLDQRDIYFGENNERAAGEFFRKGGIIVTTPDYIDSTQITYSNNTRNYGSSDNILNIDKSYPNQKRLLWVNKQVIVPIQVSITVITNSYDVIHS